jgi:hypothetical protein
MLALAPVLLIGACARHLSPSQHAAEYARSIASYHGLRVQSVSCPTLTHRGWICRGRLESGAPFECLIFPGGRAAGDGSCAAQKRK